MRAMMLFCCRRFDAFYFRVAADSAVYEAMPRVSSIRS